MCYAEGLAADPKLLPALSGLIDCMLQSSIKGTSPLIVFCSAAIIVSLVIRKFPCQVREV